MTNHLPHFRREAQVLGTLGEWEALCSVWFDLFIFAFKTQKQKIKKKEESNREKNWNERGHYKIKIRKGESMEERRSDQKFVDLKTILSLSGKIIFPLVE